VKFDIINAYARPDTKLNDLAAIKWWRSSEAAAAAAN